MKKNTPNYDVDRMRLERKINRAVEDNSSISSYTSEKIKNIYRFLESSAGSDLETVSNATSQIGLGFDNEKENVSDNSFKMSSKNKPGTGTPSKSNKLAKQVDAASYIPDHHSNSDRKRQLEIERSNEEAMARLKFLESELNEYKLKLEKTESLLVTERSTVKELTYEKNQKQSKEPAIAEAHKLREEKLKLEESLRKNMEFLDELIKDKQILSEQVSNLMSEKANYDKKKSSEIEEIKDKFQKELKANKDAWIAAEKTRKEKWLHEKTQEIKNLTIKGLEPEIERIISRNKLEIKRLEEKQQKEIERIRDDNREEYDRKLKEIKEKMLKENEEMMEKEREYSISRSKAQYERIERQYEEDRERMKRSYENESRELENMRKKETEEYLTKIKKIQENNLKELRELREDYEFKLDTVKKSHAEELGNFKERMRVEKDKWMEMNMERNKEMFEEERRKIREELTAERDNELEIIINKMTEENLSVEEKYSEKVRLHVEAAKEHSLEEIKKLKRDIKYWEDKLENETLSKRQLQRDLEVLSDQLLDMKSKLEVKEREACDFKDSIKILENELKAQKEVEKAVEQNCLRKIEYETKSLRDEKLSLQEQIERLKTKFEEEINYMEEKQVKQLEDVESKVRKAISKKESESKKLREDLRISEMKLEKYEQLLEKQRKDLMIINNK